LPRASLLDSSKFHEVNGAMGNTPLAGQSGNMPDEYTTPLRGHLQRQPEYESVFPVQQPFNVNAGDGR
jgi:hypothetical protein